MTDRHIEELIEKTDLSKPFFRARSSEVFDIGDEKVLKLYFESVDEENAGIELLNTQVAFERGCTPMECYGKVKVNGRNGLVLKKLYGISLTSLPQKNPLSLFTAGKILASLHTMVHEKEDHRLRDVRQVALDALASGPLDFLSGEERKKAENYLRSLPEADNIIHLDFHTDNIMADGKNCQVIDWMTAARGRPECELAMMHFLFHYAELFPGCSKLKLAFLGAVRVSIYNGFIKHYCRMNPGFTPESHERWDLAALVIRLGVWNVESEREYIQGRIRELVAALK